MTDLTHGRGRSFLLKPVPATFCEPIKRPVSDEHLLTAWRGVPTSEIRRRMDLAAPRDGRATREVVRRARSRVVQLREAGRG